MTTATARTWSPFQERIFDFIVNGDGSAMIYAVAGSGKTSTIEEAARRLPANNPVCYLVFNKRNADEANDRMPLHVSASTFHSAAMQGLKRRLGNVKVDSGKMRNILRDMESAGLIDRAEMDAWFSSLVRLVGIGKNAGIGALVDDDAGIWRNIMDHYDLDFDEVDEIDPTERVIEIAQQMLAASNTVMTTQRIIDFDDMLYGVVLLNASLPKYKIVMVDEAQDTNPIQVAILEKMIATNGRLIAVGDPRQAIYGFRGASSDAMEIIERRFNATRLPLSVNYRCSRAVINAAKEYCPEIIAHDNAPDGSVSPLDTLRMREFLATDAVLCRTTAPLISLAYKALAQGVGCTVLGRDIGQGLVALVKKLTGKQARMPIDVLVTRLNEYHTRESAKLRDQDNEAKAQSLDDKVASLHAAIDALPMTRRSVESLIAHIDSLFSDNGRGRLTLATVHKSKGLEYPNVYILDRNNMPLPFARQPWQVEQEYNLVYVAYTRAKVNLRFIRSDSITA